MSRTSGLRTAGNEITLSCSCTKNLGVFDSGEPGVLSKMWDAYDEHTMES